MIYQNPYGKKIYKVRTIETIKELIDSSAQIYENNPAFLIKEEKGGPYKTVNYCQLKKDIDALGTKLIDMGLSGARIAVIGENSYQWIVTYFAVVNGTGTVVPLDRELSKKEIANLMKTADCDAVFYSKQYKEMFSDSLISHKIQMSFYELEAEEGISWTGLVREGRQLLENGDRRFIDAKINPEEMKIMLFTSGTTDDAKAVMLCHKNIVSNVMNTCRIFKIKQSDRTLSVLPIHHTFESTIDIMVPLFYGASIAFYEGLKYIAKNLEEARCSVLVTVPLILESIYEKIWKQAEKQRKSKALRVAIVLHKILKAVRIDLRKVIFKSVYASFGGNLRLLITGAAAISPKVLVGFHDLGFEVAQGYGLTESAPLIAGTPDFSKGYRKAASVGPVIPEGELAFVDRNEEGIGEIIYRGPNVMMGYFDMKERTEEVLKDGWLYTGDLGFADKDGWLYITGRKKNVIVTKTGKNIYPEEIEKYLSGIKYIKECMVYGKDAEDGEDTLVSVQIRPEYDLIYQEYGDDFSANQIYDLMKKEIAELNQTIPNYKRVRHIIIRLEEFVKTTTKKIKRQENM